MPAHPIQIWEPTFTIVYKEQTHPEPITPTATTPPPAQFDDIDTDPPGGKATPIAHRSPVVSAATLSPTSPVLATAAGTPPNNQCTVDDVLSLLSQLNAINQSLKPKPDDNELAADVVAAAATVNEDDYLAADLFMSKKITNKLQQQIQDPLVLSSNSLPAWCEDLNQSCPFLFPFETRQLYFNCTAFGASRSIVWLQGQRDVTLERQRMPGLSPRRAADEQQHEFRVGRLKHERVKVARNDRLLDWAMQVMRVHAQRKSVLEVEFLGEEGTGLGPTLEFYALVAAELQRADLAMWLCDDEVAEDGGDGADAAAAGAEVDLGEGARPAGYYVRRPTGLFPAPMPQQSAQCDRVCQYFWFLGVFLAKVLQDGRLVDLPLSDSFLQLLCHNKVWAHSRSPRVAAGRRGGAASAAASAADLAELARYFSRDFPGPVPPPSSTATTATTTTTATSATTPTTPTGAATCSSTSTTTTTTAGGAGVDDDGCWYDGVLGSDNLQEIDPIRAAFLRSLLDIVQAKQAIEQRADLSAEERAKLVAELRLNPTRAAGESGVTTDANVGVAIDDLALTFTYLPPSKHSGYEAAELVPGGAEIDVRLDNLEDYCECTLQFCLQLGIARQLDAFHAGFSQVFELRKLAAFTPAEARMMICGEQHPRWTREDLMSYTEPKLGYTKER